MNHDLYVQILTSHPTDIVIRKDEDTYLVVHRLLFHWTLQEYNYPVWESYDNRWCYTLPHKAVEAVEEWRSRNWEGEPIGWHRHPPSGRRRVDGDPKREYVEA